MHISLRCVIQKIPPSWKPPLYLLILSLSQLQPCDQKLRGFAPQLASPSWDAPLSPGFTQRCWGLLKGVHHSFGFLHLLLLIPRLWESTALAPDLSLQTTPFKNKKIPHLSSNIFMDRFCPDLNKFPVFPCQTQNKKSPVSSPTPATASSCCRTVVPDEKKNMELDSEGRQCSLELLSGHKSLSGRTRTKILKWHHFAFQYLKILNIMFQRDACLLKVPESPKPSLWHWSYSHLGVPGSIHLNLSEPTIHLLVSVIGEETTSDTTWSWVCHGSRTIVTRCSIQSLSIQQRKNNQNVQANTTCPTLASFFHIMSIWYVLFSNMSPFLVGILGHTLHGGYPELPIKRPTSRRDRSCVCALSSEGLINSWKGQMAGNWLGLLGFWGWGGLFWAVSLWEPGG